MKFLKIAVVVVATILAGCVSSQADRSGDAAAYDQLAPTGIVRAAILVGPAASPFRATLDPATGRPRGVPVDLAAALGEKLALPVELVTYSNYPEFLDGASRGVWDVTFVPFDEARAKVMDYGPAYYYFDFTYLVAASSTIRDQSEVDRPGVRIAVAEGSVTARNRERGLKGASVVHVKTLDEIRKLVQDGKVDAVAAGRDTLVGLAKQLPGSRVLDGHFHVEAVAIAVPRGRPAALTYACKFMESAKTTGVVRRALDDGGFKDAAVAPAGSRTQ